MWYMGTQLPQKRGAAAAGWLKIPLGMEVDLGPGRVVLYGDPAPPPQKKGGAAAAPQFSAHLCCGQTAASIKMAFGIEVDLGPGNKVLDGTQLSPQKETQKPPIFGPCLLLPNIWMDQDTTLHGGRPQPWPRC